MSSIGNFCCLKRSSVADGLNVPRATPMTCSLAPLTIEVDAQATSSTCALGSTPAEVRNCSNWRKRLGSSCSRRWEHPGDCRAQRSSRARGGATERHGDQKGDKRDNLRQITCHEARLLFFHVFP